MLAVREVGLVETGGFTVFNVSSRDVPSLGCAGFGEFFFFPLFFLFPPVGYYENQQEDREGKRIESWPCPYYNTRLAPSHHFSSFLLFHRAGFSTCALASLMEPFCPLGSEKKVTRNFSWWVGGSVALVSGRSGRGFWP